MQTSTLSPGSTRLSTTASCPAEPVPLIAIVSRFFVRKTCAQHRLQLVHDPQVVRIEMPDRRAASAARIARMGVAWSRAEEHSNGRIYRGG